MISTKPDLKLRRRRVGDVRRRCIKCSLFQMFFVGTCLLIGIETWFYSHFEITSNNVKEPAVSNNREVVTPKGHHLRREINKQNPEKLDKRGSLQGQQSTASTTDAKPSKETAPDYYMYDMTDPDLAWIGGISKEATKDAIATCNNGRCKVHLVVSHCDKPLDYILEKFIKTKADQDRIATITIASKCGNPIVGAPESEHFHTKVITLPNVGRCDHTYAYWISNIAYNDVDQYDDDDIVYFIKDNDYQVKNWRNFEDMFELAAINGFSCAQVTKFNKQVNVSYFHQSEMLTHFNIDFHTREGKGKDNEEEVANQNQEFASEYDRLGAYADHLGFNVPRPYSPVCYGGAFAAKVSQLRNEKVDVWKKMEKSLSRADNLKEGHFAERLWAPMLTKPLSDETNAIINGQQKSARCESNNKQFGWGFWFANHCGILALEEES